MLFRSSPFRRCKILDLQRVWIVNRTSGVIQPPACPKETALRGFPPPPISLRRIQNLPPARQPWPTRTGGTPTRASSSSSRCFLPPPGPRTRPPPGSSPSSAPAPPTTRPVRSLPLPRLPRFDPSVVSRLRVRRLLFRLGFRRRARLVFGQSYLHPS